MTLHGSPLRRAYVLVLVVVLFAFALLGSRGTAWAHGSDPGGSVRVVQSFAARDVVVTLAPPVGPGTMPVVITGLGDAPATTLGVELVPRDTEPERRQRIPLTVAPENRHARTTIEVARSGLWDLALDDGRVRALIPVTVNDPLPGSPAAWVMRGGIVLAVIGGVAAVAVRRRPRAALAVGAVALIGFSVSITVAATGSASTPVATSTVGGAGGAPRPSQGMSSMPGMEMGPDDAMPPMDHGDGPTVSPSTTDAAVTMRVSSVEPSSAPGGRNAVRLDLTDGSTGAPVDDLTVHDQALIHLVVIGPDGAFLHTHPVRVAPGTYLINAMLPAAGGIGLFAEIERASGGVQVARAGLTVDGPVPAAQTVDGPVPAAQTAGVPGLGARTVADIAAVVTTDSPPVAGRPTTLRLTAADRTGGPIRDLQPWLGMAGHMMTLGPPRPDGASRPEDVATVDRIFAHTHDMRAPGPLGQYGPDLAFVHTFPDPGRYQVWIQFQRGWRVETVPVTLDVAALAPPA